MRELAETAPQTTLEGLRVATASSTVVHSCCRAGAWTAARDLRAEVVCRVWAVDHRVRCKRRCKKAYLKLRHRPEARLCIHHLRYGVLFDFLVPSPSLCRRSCYAWGCIWHVRTTSSEMATLTCHASLFGSQRRCFNCTVTRTRFQFFLAFFDEFEAAC